MRVLLALSGGVDSAVAAHLLRREGHDVIGIRFGLWSDPLAPAAAQVLTNKCCTAQTAWRAQSVADQLRIPLHVVDLGDLFKARVVDPFLRLARRGGTLNPCIPCNRFIKIGSLLSFAKQWECDAVATGHFARVERRACEGGACTFHLLEAVDERKDQSYFLSSLTQRHLSRLLLPLGTLRKEEVFRLANEFGVPLDDGYRESQDLCFYPEKDPHAFLQRHAADACVPGSMKRRDGSIVGRHRGLPLYTVGQRRGLGVGGLKIPLEVVEKDARRNVLVVEEQGAERVAAVKLRGLHWINSQTTAARSRVCDGRMRSLAPRVRGTLTWRGRAGTFAFQSSVPPPTPGQTLVLYEHAEIIGSAIIAGPVSNRSPSSLGVRQGSPLPAGEG